VHFPAASIRLSASLFTPVQRRFLALGRLRQDRPVIDADAAAAMTLEDHRRGFAAAMAVLIA